MLSVVVMEIERVYGVLRVGHIAVDKFTAVFPGTEDIVGHGVAGICETGVAVIGIGAVEQNILAVDSAEFGSPYLIYIGMVAIAVEYLSGFSPVDKV